MKLSSVLWLAAVFGFQANAYRRHGTTKSVTAYIGESLTLRCHVENLSRGTVTWIRLRDFAVLAVGESVNTADERLTVSHTDGSSIWSMEIKFVTAADAGQYECRHGPARITTVFDVAIKEAETTIEGNNLHVVSSGKPIKLKCIIVGKKEIPRHVFWYHNDRLINYDSSVTDITLEMMTSDTAVSELTTEDARPNDSGNYTCSPSNAPGASIWVQVLNTTPN